MLKKTIFHETHEIVFQTIPSDMSREMMPAMGRPFSLGYLYDKRTDTILNKSPWPLNDTPLANSSAGYQEFRSTLFNS